MVIALLLRRFSCNALPLLFCASLTKDDVSRPGLECYVMGQVASSKGEAMLGLGPPLPTTDSSNTPRPFFLLLHSQDHSSLFGLYRLLSPLCLTTSFHPRSSWLTVYSSSFRLRSDCPTVRLRADRETSVGTLLYYPRVRKASRVLWLTATSCTCAVALEATGIPCFPLLRTARGYKVQQLYR